MAQCKWYQVGCMIDRRQAAKAKDFTETIPDNIEDITSRQLWMVAGVGVAVLALVAVGTR